MNVHIVCQMQPPGRIIPRLARGLADATGWSISVQPDPHADVNYLFPYLEGQRERFDTPVAALFTHREDVQPRKVEVWARQAEAVNLRITWAQQYERDLATYGPTLRVLPPLDRRRFSPAAVRETNDPLRVGVSGYTYSAGRKGEGVLAEALKDERLRGFEWSAVGRGWPVRAREIDYAALPDWYRNLDIYVCPSLIEGVPYGPLEALACGTPVVIPHGVGLLDDVLPDDLPGVAWYDAGSADGLVGALLRARDQLPNIDRDALRELTAPFTMSGWVEAHRQAFERLAGGAEREERARAAGQGIFIVAYGDNARTCATRLIDSIRQHMPDVPVAVVSTDPLPGADLHVYHEDADAGARTAKTKLYDLAPPEWERVLYLDADTELTAPIPFLFDALRNGWELVICKDINGYDLTHSLYRRDSAERALGMQALGSDRALQLAGGVMGFRRTPAVQRFLSGWYAEWYRIGRRDQGALLRTLYRNPVRLLVLGNEWNTFDGCKECTAGIVHHRGGPARRLRSWAGRLDDPEVWRRAQGEQVSTPWATRGAAPRVGTVGSAHRGAYHGAAVARIRYLGPKLVKRVLGRSGSTYRFQGGNIQTISADDATYLTAHDPQTWEVGDVDCPVCGAPDGACAPAEKTPAKISGEIKQEEDTMERHRRPRLPRQQASPGTTVGYVGEARGDVEVYEPGGNGIAVDVEIIDTPPDEEEPEPEPVAEEANARKRRKAAPQDKARKTRTKAKAKA